MNLSPEQIAANRKSAENIARNQLSLSSDSSSWSYEERTAYLKALAKVILAYPDRFSDQDVINARNVDKKDYAPLEAENSFGQNVGEFASAFWDNADELVGKPLVALGQNTGKVFSFIGNVGPYLALAAGLFIAYQFLKAKGKQASST